MKEMKEIVVPSKIIIPNCDLQKWVTLASDRYIESPIFWKRKLKFLGNNPSSLFFSYPLVFRNDKTPCPYNVKDKIKIFEKQNIFNNEYDGYILVEREIQDGKRIGLVASVVPSRICITENVHMQNVKLLQESLMNSDFDLPHIILLLDDKKNCIQFLYNNREKYEKVYDFYLPNSNFNIKGWFLPKNDSLVLDTIYKINNLDYPYLFVGDGNHTLYAIQDLVSQKKHQDIYLTEIVDLNAEAVRFNPIYRTIHIKEKDLSVFLEELREKILPTESGQKILKIMVLNKSYQYYVEKDSIEIISLVQDFLNTYSLNNNKRIYYSYNYDEFIASIKNGNVGIILPEVTKEEYMYYILRNKKLPEKAFSIGLSYDKRYYLECRRVEKL